LKPLLNCVAGCVERAAASPALCARVLFNLTAATAAAAASFEMTAHLMGFALVAKTQVMQTIDAPRSTHLDTSGAGSAKPPPSSAKKPSRAKAAAVGSAETLERHRVARLLCSLMAVDASSPPLVFARRGAAVRAAAAAAATQLARHAWVEREKNGSTDVEFASRGDHALDLLHAGDAAGEGSSEASMLRVAVESALAGADGADGDAKTHALVQEGCSALLMWLSTAAWHQPPDTPCVVRFLDLLQAADDAHTLMHLVAALWYLLRHTGTRNRLMDAVYTHAEEAEEAAATEAMSPRMNPEVGATTTGGGGGDGDSASSDSESETDGNLTLTDTAGETTMDEGTDGERTKRAHDEQRAAEAAAAAAAAAAPTSGRCLYVLERLGSRWVRRLKECEKADDAVVKLFELWAASLWLALYRTEDQVEATTSVYARTDRCTFTVGPLWTAPLQARPKLTQRLLGVLQELMELHQPVFAAVRELALGLAWNLARRDVVLEARLAATGVSHTLLRCLCDAAASVQVRRMAAGWLHQLLGRPQHRVRLERLRTLPHAHAALVALAGERCWPLAQVAAHGLAHRTFHAKEVAPLHRRGALPALVALLEDLEAARSEGQQGENPTVAMARLYSLVALLNMSTHRRMQTSVAKHALHIVLQVCAVEPPGAEARQVAEAALSNLSQHPRNRTRLYRHELSYKAATLRQSMAAQGLLEGGGDADDACARPGAAQAAGGLPAEGVSGSGRGSGRGSGSGRGGAAGGGATPAAAAAQFTAWAAASFGEEAMDVEGAHAKDRHGGPLDPYRARSERAAHRKARRAARKAAKKAAKQAAAAAAKPALAAKKVGAPMASRPSTTVSGPRAVSTSRPGTAGVPMTQLRHKLTQRLGRTWEELGTSTSPPRPATAASTWTVHSRQFTATDHGFSRPGTTVGASRPHTTEPASRARAIATTPSAIGRARTPLSMVPGTKPPPPPQTFGSKGVGTRVGGTPKPKLNPTVSIQRQSSVRERGGGDSARAEEERGSMQNPLLQAKLTALSGLGFERPSTSDAVSFSSGVQKFLGLKRAALDRWSVAARPTTTGGAEATLLPGLGRRRDLWAPSVERFHEAPASHLSIPKVARRLLNVRCPPAVAHELGVAAKELADAVTADQLMPEGRLRRAARPSAAALTAPIQPPPPDLGEGRAGVTGRRDPSRGGYRPDSAMTLPLPVAELRLTAAEAAPAFAAASQLESPRASPPRALPLTVAPRLELSVQLGAARARNTMRFCVRTPAMVQRHPAARTVLFEHVAGCTVCAGVYAHFRLPNGKLAHFFDKGSELRDELDVPPLPPPPQPTTLAMALQVTIWGVT
jgi:hypothetical protein